MAARERGVIKPPNLGPLASNHAANGFLSLDKQPNGMPVPNLSRFMHGDPGGSADMTHMASPINPPNDGKFRDGDVGHSDADKPAAMEPGKGAVPVNPFTDARGETTLRQAPTSTLKSR